MIDRTWLAVLFGLLSFTYGLQCPKQRKSPGREVVCYTSVSDVEQLTEAVCRCTTLVHQGHDARNFSISELKNFQKSLKEINPPLQFVISVDDPGKILRTSGTVRQEITARLIVALKEIDGVELNMTAGSKERLVHFVKGLKDELVRKSYDKRIFLVLPTKSEYLAKQFDLKELSKYVDLFTIPTHYLVEDDEANRAFHPSRLMGLFDMYNADSLIDLISGLGAPKRKILMSVPASAYKFTLKDQDDNAPRAPTEESQPVIIDQKQLCDLMNKGEWTVERDEDLTAPYAFKDKTWIAFEDKISISIKGKYVMLRELPGLAVHNIENDFKTKCGIPVTEEAYHSFTDFKRKSRAAVLNALEDDLHQKELEYATQVKSSDFRVVRVVDTEGHIRAVRENTQTEFTCSRQGYFVHPKSCNRFYRCVKFNQEVEDYSVFEFDCPAGLSFDERTEVCVWPGSLPQGSPCPGSSEIAPVARIRFECPSKPGYYADPQNPRWFFACIDLGGPEIMAYEFRCPFGLIFDEQKFICEWPWLVRGYSDTDYTKSGYGSGVYGTGTTAGTGGYYTGGLPHGYTGTTGSGVYTGSQGGASYHGSDSGFSGAAGVGYTHGSSFGQGTTGSGYSGSGAGGHGVSYGGQGSSGYTGATGTGAGGRGGSYGGQGSHGYTGTVGSGTAGHGTYEGQGTTGSGYSGSGAGHGGSYGGQGSSGYTGTAGSGAAGHGTYEGQGTTGGGYSGSGAAGHGGSYSGQGSPGYTGATGSGGAGHGGSYSGQGSPGYTGATGSGAAAHGTYDGQGTTGSGYSGSGAAGHGVLYGGQGSPGYTGAAGSGGAGHGGSYSGQGSPGYTGATGSGGAGHAGSYSGQGSPGYTGATGSGAAGHGTYESQGTTGSGYSGSGAAGHGISYGGQGSPGYTGATGSGATGHGGSYGGHGSPGYTGTAGSGATGHGTYEGKGTTGSSYSGSGAAGHGVSNGGQGSPGYTGATGSGGAGHGGSYGGQGSPGYTGATGSGGAGHGGSYSGQGSPGYTGATGSGGTGHGTYESQGTTGSGYSGSGAAGHGISYGSQGSTGYTGTVSKGHGTSYNGQGSTGYTGTAAGGRGSSYSGQEASFGQGTTGSGYSGPTAGGHGTSYSGQGPTGYSGATGTGYAGSTAGGQATIEYSGPGKEGEEGSDHEVSNGPGYNVVQSTGYTGTSGVFTGSSGTKYSGSTYPSGTGSSSVPGHGYTGPGFTGHGTGSGYPGTRPPGTLFADKPDRPNVDCGTPCFGGTQPTGGQTYVTGNHLPGQGITSGSNVYQGTHGYGGVLNVTLTGSHIPSSGSATYYGSVTPTSGYGVTAGAGAGVIATGHNVQGSIITGESTPGTLITYGDTSGTILGGSSDQGSIVTGGSQPGYIKTGAGSPGYVIAGGVKTVYPGSGSPETVVYGTHSPGVIVTGAPEVGTVIKGQTSPGTFLTGHSTPGVSIGGTIGQGTIVGSTGHHVFTDTGYSTQQGGVTPGIPYGTRTGSIPSTYDSGYKTNEYYDNGGHSTIKFNNGDVVTKFTENDIPDYRPNGGTIPPDTLFPGVKGSSKLSTPSGFTKTGPTKTGFTTATLGTGGSYMISTGKTYPTPNPDHIGAKAFEGSVAGYTKTSTESTFDSVDTSKITLGPFKGSGYSYPTPSIPFETGVTKNLPVSSTEGSIYTATTPTPFLNVEVYNTPKFYPQPSGFTHGPSSTSTPVYYTTGPLDNYKTTPFESVKTPFTISTVQPGFSNGYKTFVSSTPAPVTLSPNKYSDVQTGSQFDYGTKTSQQGVYGGRKGYFSSTTPSPAFGVPSSTYSPGNQFNYGTTASSGSAYFGSTSKNVFGQGTTPSSLSESLKPQTQYLPGGSISPVIGVTYKNPYKVSNEAFQHSTPISLVTPKTYTVESSTISGGSPTNIAIPRDEVGKLITNYNRGTTKYVPSEYDVYQTGSKSGADYSRTQSSSESTFQRGYGTSTPASISNSQSPFAVTTYSEGYSRPTSILTYQTTAKSTAVGKAKVIVKWSDLHPLLLGKLGAECTCRGDPFANLRGPGSKLISSSKGKVDLSNYDESEIYVDLEKEGSYDDNDYVTNYESSSSKPIKIWNEYSSKLLTSSSSQTQEKPSSTYLPSVTPSVTLGVRGSLSGFASNQGLAGNHRSGKSLSNVGSSTNSFVTRPSFEGDGTSEEILEGTTNCARPGLFRHPNFCNKFYACHWDEWKKKFTLHVFSCPVHLTFDNGAGACNWPSMGPACQDDNLLV
ncbi:Ribosome-binding protein 1 [Anthophora quadrimaculata]